MTLGHHSRQSAFFAALLFAFGMATAAAAADAPTVKPAAADTPKRVLFVGNSYLYYGDSLHNHVRRMAAAVDAKNEKQYRYKSATISGSALHHHNIAAYLESGKLGIKEPFEVVVLQGGSGSVSSDERRGAFAATVADFDKEIKKHGARTALYMTHAYVKPHKKADPNMIRDIEKLYVETGNKVGALVIPVGLAFEEAYKQRPDMKLHKQFDGSHPDLIGTYLAACVVFASLYDRSPVGNPYDYYGAIDKDTALFLQKVADKTVRGFYGQPLAEALSAK
ncbi:MAG: DUF4886 domain-containing protein [Alphaproteobacteria bacterium]